MINESGQPKDLDHASSSKYRKIIKLKLMLLKILKIERLKRLTISIAQVYMIMKTLIEFVHTDERLNEEMRDHSPNRSDFFFGENRSDLMVEDSQKVSVQDKPTKTVDGVVDKVYLKNL